MVSGLVSEKTSCSPNLLQTFAAIETIEVTLDSGLPLIPGVKVAFDLGVVSWEVVSHTIIASPRIGVLRRLDALMKTCGSWERAESREAPEALQKCAWVVEEGTRWDWLWLL